MYIRVIITCLLWICVVGELQRLLDVCFVAQAVAQADSSVDWIRLGPGLDQTEISVSSSSHPLVTKVLVLRVSLSDNRIALLASSDGRMTAKSLVKSQGALAGVNANFFDTSGAPLGVAISDGELKSNMHKGGKLLTGVFFIDDLGAHIVHRSQFDVRGVVTAVQAGPRLIAGGELLKVASPEVVTRRSGVAILDERTVLFYCTRSRFPGASFSQIQKMLKELGVSDALNLDGGSSSQIYIGKMGDNDSEREIFGGDMVPTVLAVFPRGKS